MTVLINSQADAAEAIKALVAESDAAARTSAEKALEAGKLLVDAKEAAAHGTWLPFLQRAGVPERKAQRLMTLARSGLKSDAVTDLGGVKASLEWCARFESHSKQIRALHYRPWADLMDYLIEAGETGDEQAFIDVYKATGLTDEALAHDLTILTEFFVTFREYGVARAGSACLNPPYSQARPWVAQERTPSP